MNLKNIRVKLKLTQAELAKKTGMNTQQVSNYECGRNEIPLTRVTQISKVLKIPKEKLIDLVLAKKKERLMKSAR